LWGDSLRAALAALATEAERAGRDPSALELTISGPAQRTTPETVETLAQLGVTRLVVTCTNPDLSAARDEMSAVAEQLGLAGGG
jgi:hypothetical protein